jgi:hypothetical protein
MAIEKPKAILLAAMFLFCIGPLMYAQNSGYFLDTSGGEPRFTQRLSWVGDEYVSHYEVVLEREEEGRYRELRRESTTAPFVEVSLVPGKYRCYVTPYDFLGQPGERSEMYIEVLAALYPELDDSFAEFVYSDNDLVYEMSLSGKDMVPGADVYLRGPNGEHIVPSEAHVKEDGSEVRLLFDKDRLLPGDYELIVRNPGGLEAYGGVTVVVRESAVPELTDAPQKKVNLFLGVGWMPSVTIYDKGNRFFDDKWSPVGAAIRLGIVSAKPGIINLGAELTEAWGAPYGDPNGRATHFDSTVNFLMQKRPPGEKTAATFRLGIGFSLPLFDLDEYSPPFADLFYTNIGVSLLGFIGNVVYLEGGIDYAHWFRRPFSGNFRPWLGMGLRF